MDVDSDSQTIERKLSSPHSHLPRVFFMHEIILQSEVVGSENGRITAGERLDTTMSRISEYSVLEKVKGSKDEMRHGKLYTYRIGVV